MKRLLCLTVALVVLAGCGMQGAPEETTVESTTQTTEAPTTTQVIVPKISPEEAVKIISKIVGEDAYFREVNALDPDLYYCVYVPTPGGEGGDLYGNYHVHKITGEPFEPNRVRGDVVGASLPLKRTKYYHVTYEDYQAAEATGKELFSEWSGIFRFVQREGRKYCIYGVGNIMTHKHDYVYRDLATNALFLWNLNTDTLTPYISA